MSGEETLFLPSFPLEVTLNSQEPYIVTDDAISNRPRPAGVLLLAGSVFDEDQTSASWQRAGYTTRHLATPVLSSNRQTLECHGQHEIRRQCKLQWRRRLLHLAAARITAVWAARVLAKRMLCRVDLLGCRPWLQPCAECSCRCCPSSQHCC